MVRCLAGKSPARLFEDRKGCDEKTLSVTL
jgi:hypothetical protein